MRIALPPDPWPSIAEAERPPNAAKCHQFANLGGRYLCFVPTRAVTFSMWLCLPMSRRREIQSPAVVLWDSRGVTGVLSSGFVHVGSKVPIYNRERLRLEYETRSQESG